MPIYENRCPDGHTTEVIRKYADRDAPTDCPTCGQSAERIISAHHRQPDGIYSHTPNLGDPVTFEKRHYGESVE